MSNNNEPARGTSRGIMSRRTLLRGLGLAIGLPLLEAMAPNGLLGEPALAGGDDALIAAGLGGSSSSSSTPAGKRLRMAFITTPNGMWMDNFLPKTPGPLTELPPTLKPLEALRSDIMVLSGLAQANAGGKGDGAGDHARSSAVFLTGVHPFKTAGANIKLGVSVDQFAAKAVGQATHLPSMELGCDAGRKAGECDSGYSCAYVSNISWADETTPMPKQIDPAAVFDRMFGIQAAGGQDAVQHAMDMARRLAERKSILDYVKEDSMRIKNQVGISDQRKIDEFSTSLREIERRIENSMKSKGPPVPPQGTVRPKVGIPKDYAEHMKLMYDLMVIAFQTDATRIATFLAANEGSGRTFTSIGVTGAHHELSHHGKKPDSIEGIKKIDLFYLQQFAYFLKRLKDVKEGSGSLLDNCMIVYGSGISDGDRHNHDELPIILAGKGGGTIVPGRHVKYPQGTPLCNLYLSMLQRAQVKATSFGDSKAPLAQLA